MGDPTFPLNYPLWDERVQRLGRLGRRRKRFPHWHDRADRGWTSVSPAYWTSRQNGCPAGSAIT